jgi:hypothetical protein
MHVTLQTIDANRTRDYWRLFTEQRDELCTLIRSHGFDPHNVGAVTYDVIDAPLLRVREFLTDNGRRYIDPATGNAATADREVALRTPLPAWWTPDLS